MSDMRYRRINILHIDTEQACGVYQCCVGVGNNWGVVRVKRGLASNEVGVLHPAISEKPEAQV